MILSAQIAKHLRDVHFGGNWTTVNLKDTLEGLNWRQATAPVSSLNTIATLVFHMNYYVAAILGVLRGGALNAHDKYSFDRPPIQSEDDWQRLVDKSLREAEELADLIEALPDEQMWEAFTDEKYGSYYRNFHGLIEHAHYHLGQISLIKKILLQEVAGQPAAAANQ